MKNRNTSGLRKHLISFHKKESQIFFPVKSKLSGDIASFFVTAGRSGQSENSTDNITIATVDWVVKKYLPFSFFDDEVYFRRICPNMVFPKRSTLRRKVKERFEELQLNLKEYYEEYYTLHSLNKSLKLSRKENKVYDEDEDVIDFDKLFECPPTSSGSCLQGFVIDELEEYLRKPRAASSEDILDWWRTHETEYSTLSKMARDILSIPATSVPAERLFSKASLVIRKHRNRLSDE